MALKPSQFASDITAADIRELCKNRVAEDVYIEFKQILFTFPGKTPELVAKLTEDQIDDTLADIVSFANAFGGHLVVGIEEKAHRAHRLAPLPQDAAVKIAQIIRDRAAVFVKPRIVLLEAVPFPMGRGTKNWVVIVTIPPGESRPHMSAFRDQTRFTIRDGNRKRSMTNEEIRDAFLAGPQQTAIAGIYAEIRGLRTLIEHGTAEKSEKM